MRSRSNWTARSSSPVRIPHPGAFTVARYTSTGRLDTSFGTDGISQADFGASDSYRDDDVEGVAIQRDGAIITAGFSMDTFSGELISRLPASRPAENSIRASVVPAKVQTGFRGSAQANAVAIQRDGKIVLAGSSGGDLRDFAVVRYNPDGSLDSGG